MSRAGALMWQAGASGVQNAGDAVLRALEDQRRQDLADKQLALTDRIQSGQLDIAGQRLNADIDSAQADRRQRYTMAGFEPGGGEEAGEMRPDAETGPGEGRRPSILDQPVDITRGAKLGMESLDARPSNPGDAVLSLLRNRGGGEPQYRYNPAGDPRAVLQDRQNTFLGGENAADRTSREGMSREEIAARRAIADLTEGGANTRNAADIASREKVAGMQYGPDRMIREAEIGAQGPHYDIMKGFVYPNADSVHAGFSRLGQLQSGGAAGGGLSPTEVAALRAEAAKSSPDAVAAQYQLTPAEKAQAFGQ